MFIYKRAWKFSIILALVALLSPSGLKAQSESWKSTDWQIGAGSTYIFDDYLSPISYSSLSFRFSTENFKPIGNFSNPDNAKWYNQNYFQLIPAYTSTLSGASFYHIQADLRNSTYMKFYQDKSWVLYAGGSISLRGGGRLVRQTRNNPGSADLMTDLGVSFIAKYKLKLWGRPLEIRYCGNLSLLGLAFSPEYAQSYYEIFYLGNYSNTTKFTTLFNKQHWVQQLSIDIPLTAKKSCMRISYWNEGRISLLNDINTRVFTDQLTVGYIRYFKVL